MATTNHGAPGKAGPRSNGLIPIPASATKKPATSSSHPRPDLPSRATAPRLKMIVRRLPPGLTQEEFDAALGEEWKVNGGKVDWAAYKPGKISKDLSKPSRPSRAYLHLMKQEHVSQLSDKIRTTNFSDAKASTKDASLLGPPNLEFSTLGRVPHNKPRKDLRQGTIDQDQEFIDFLESLTNPIQKTSSVDQENEATKTKEKVTITPLVQYLKDKKANKGKEPASAKAAKHGRQDSKDSKAGSTPDKKAPSKATSAASPDKRSAQAIKVENAARDAVKVLNKQVSIVKKPSNSLVSNAPASTPSAASTAEPLAEKKRERGTASAAARILQRDLGLSGSQNRRGARGGRNNVPPDSKAAEAKSPPLTPLPATKKESIANTKPTPTGNATVAPQPSSATSTSTPAPESGAPSTPVQPPTGPAASRTTAKPHSQPRGGNSPNTPRTPQISPTATQAFLKHANPSQGITEPLLQEAFTPFGSVTKVEIDKKKGFAYVDFAAPEGLQSAIKASPIKVAQGSVVVLERKTGPTLQARHATPRGGMGPRGGASPQGRGGGPPVAGARGGAPPTAPRGRGGSRGRGGMGRGGSGAAKQPQASTTAGSEGSAAPGETPSTAPQAAAAAPAAEESQGT